VFLLSIPSQRTDRRFHGVIVRLVPVEEPSQTRLASSAVTRCHGIARMAKISLEWREMVRLAPAPNEARCSRNIRYRKLKEKEREREIEWVFIVSVPGA